MRVIGKANANTTLGTNQNQPFSFLRHSKVGSIENTPFTLIADGSETFFHLLDRLAIVVSGQTDNILHHENRRSEKIDKVSELLEERIPGIIIVG